MKRMNEVFELPVVPPTTREAIGMTEKQVDRMTCAAHAINHADALADALEKCMPHMQYLSEISGVVADIHYESMAALKAYRG